jgi:hypothetical protein
VSLQKLLVYFCDCKKKRKKKMSQCVIATIWRALLQSGKMCGCKKKNLTLSAWLKKETW